MMRLKYSILLLPLATIGCGLIPSIEINTKPKTTVVAPNAADVQVLADSMKDMPKEDIVKLRKIFVGLQEYLSHGKRIKTTTQVLTIIKSFEDDYGYTIKRYPAYDTAGKKFLMDKYYNKAKTIVEKPEEIQPPVNGITKQILRSDVINDIKVLADATKVALNGK